VGGQDEETGEIAAVGPKLFPKRYNALEDVHFYYNTGAMRRALLLVSLEDLVCFRDLALECLGVLEQVLELASSSSMPVTLPASSGCVA